MIVFLNFVHLPSAMESNNTDAVIIIVVVDTSCDSVRREDDHKGKNGVLINLF
jgi:hypothetical protein